MTIPARCAMAFPGTCPPQRLLSGIEKERTRVRGASGWADSIALPQLAAGGKTRPIPMIIRSVGRRYLECIPAAKLPGVTADTIIEFIGLSWVDEVAFRGALDAHMTSSPMSRLRALNGTIDKVALPSALWRSVKRSAGVTKPEFDQYFRGAKCAFGIVVRRVWKLNPISLATLRQARIRPPQSYHYIDTSMAIQLGKGITARPSVAKYVSGRDGRLN